MSELDGLARLTAYLRALLSSGQPLPEGFAALSATVSNRAESALLARIAGDLAAGTPLSAAVTVALGRSAPPLLGTLLKAGEASGRLREAVDALASYYETQRDLNRQLRTALLYPRVAFLMLVALVFPTLAWVQRQLLTDRDFAGASVSTPLARLLDLLSGTLLAPFNHGPAVTGLIALFTFLVLFGGIAPLDRLTSRVARWIFASGALRRAATAAALSRGLSLLLGSGVPVPDALKLLAGCTTDLDARRQIEDAGRRAEAGLSVGQALTGVTALPASFAWFLSLGDGQAPAAALGEAARFYEDEARDRAQLMANAAQPLVVLALTVAFLPSATILARLMSVVGAMG